MVALDLPGFGFSEMPRENITIERYGAVRGRAHGPARASTRPRSWATRWAASSAPRWRSRFPSASSGSSSSRPPVSGHEQWRARPLVLPDRVARAYGARLAAQWEFAWPRDRLRLPALAWAGVRHPRKIPLDLAYEIMRGSRRRRLPPTPWSAIWDYKLRERLPEIEAPTLIVWGSHDPLVPRPARLRARAAHPEHSRRRSCSPDTGHEAMFERPARFNALLDAFLADDAGRRRPDQPRDGALGGAGDELGVLRHHAADVGRRAAAS